MFVYENILGIACYHILDYKFNIYDKLNLNGIGKIASNAASELYMMFFANCDEVEDQHLGGTVQLIEHT